MSGTNGDGVLSDTEPSYIEVPGAVVGHRVEPATPEALAELLARAARERAGLLVVGGATRLGLANPARGITVAVSTRRLAGILEFEPEEGVLRAAAGTPIRRIRDRAMEEGWELPIDAAGEHTTLGGALASAATGPRGHAFGRVADAILGLEVAGSDGQLTRCGGRVVKNVTGYDLAKLYCGSFGSLGVITSAWLRLRPIPALRRAFEADVPAGAPAFEACRSLAGLGSMRALVWQAGRGAGEEKSGDPITRGSRLVVELAGAEPELLRDLAEIERGITTDLAELTPESVDRLRDERGPRGDAPIQLRARVPGRHCAELSEAVSAAGLSVEVDLGPATVHARGALGDPSELRGLRARAEGLGGFMVFEALPDSWRGELDVFGEMGENADLMRALKQRFDPHSVLNPGRFVAGC